MISRYEVVLNGISLESLSPHIVITDVSYAPPQYQRDLFTLAQRQGGRIVRSYKEKASVSISFQIRAYDIIERQGICQKICHWAKDGGDLRINDRPGQKLVCVCDSPPAIESVRGWTEELTVVFAAYAIPYWQAVEPTEVTLNIEHQSSVPYEEAGVPFSIFVPGNAPLAYMNVSIAFQSMYDPITEIWNLDDPGYAFRIDGGFGDTSSTTYREVRMDYDSNNVLNVYEVGHVMPDDYYVNTSILWAVKDTDEIYVKCGQTNNFKFLYGYVPVGGGFVQDACDVTFSVRGLWE